MANQFEGLDAFLDDLDKNARTDENVKKRSIALKSGVTRNNELKVLLFPNKDNKYYDMTSIVEHEIWFKYFSKKENKFKQFPMQFLNKTSYGKLDDAESALYDEVLDLFNKYVKSGKNRNEKGFSSTSVRSMVAVNAYVISDSNNTEPNYYTLYFRNPKSFSEGLNTFFSSKAGELGIDEDCKVDGSLSIRKCCENEEFAKMFLGTFNNLTKNRPGLLIINQVNQTTNYNVKLTYSPNVKLIENTLGKGYDLTEAKEYFLNHTASETYIGDNIDPVTGSLFNKAYFERLRDNLKDCMKDEIDAEKAKKVDLSDPANNSQELLDAAKNVNEEVKKDDLPF